MKQEEDKWAKSYRDRLDDYAEPVSMEVWESLQKELTAPPLKQRTPYRKLVVAAAVLFAIVSSLSLFFLQTPQAEFVREARVVESLPEPSRDLDPLLPQKETKKVAKAQSYINQHQIAGEQLVVGRKEIQDEIIEEEKLPVEVEDKPKKAETNQAEVYAPSGRNEYSGTKSNYAQMRYSPKKEKDWAVGLLVGNVPTSANGHSGLSDLSPGMSGRDVPYSISELMIEESGIVNSAAQEAYRQILINNLNKEAYTDTRHKMPFTVGVSFRYGISSRFSIETGLNYTFLSSEWRAGSSSDYYLKEQRLHYIGIPLKGNWMFLNRKYFSLYLSAGGMMEKCVSGSLNTDFVTSQGNVVEENKKQRVKPLQWSVSSAIGAQFNATRHVGIFIEPGIVYYFNDGSPVETIRKEKPFNFNLQMGLRFTY